MQNSGAICILFLLAIGKLTPIFRTMALCLKKTGSLLCVIVSEGYDCPGSGSGCPTAALFFSEEWDQTGKE